MENSDWYPIQTCPQCRKTYDPVEGYKDCPQCKVKLIVEKPKVKKGTVL
jgi:ssDNA-binding Zn-finger/Zn-ribbon topoisomerase 1